MSAQVIGSITDFRQGDTKFVQIDYGDLVDITGYIHFLTLRENFEDASPVVAQVKAATGSHVLDQVLNGKAFLELDSDLSTTIPVGAYVYDVQRVKPNGANPVDVLTLYPSVTDLNKVIQVAPQVTKITSI